MEYYSVIRKDEIVPFVTTWMDLEIIVLSEISQTEKVERDYLFLGLVVLFFCAWGPQPTAATMLRQIIGQAKKHPSLIPLFVFIGAGGTGASLYVMRLALFNPDVCWDKKNNPEPWNKMGPNQQYKFYSVNVDYSKLKKEGPDF
ncbi:hypothetical protein mRhiFer1_009409 [Rhinolophus ferrumequinum]|uniref:Cytochrome c oxidase subunit NDUFA4 n=2 Tax=Rhinolophus ferrumequinum TaxID=59479 RepID=A0A7J7RQB0_RHIFE|nr:hypothetical protein mRhiFer1_009409 [Rhinolophus ferrumequinum]